MRRVYLRRRAVLLAAVAAVLIGLVSIIGGGDDDGEGLSVTAETAEADAASSHRRDAETIDRVLRHTTYVRKGRPSKRRVALTFDDGPGPDTLRILEILDRYEAKATFFSLGVELSKRPTVARQALLVGHTFGGHTDGHARMGALAEADQKRELRLQDAAFARAGLPVPRLFRPPYGSFDPMTLLLLGERRSLLVLWSVDTGDFAGPDAEAIARHVLDEAEPGAIILMHDGPGPRPQTVAALPAILEGLRSRGLQPVTVPELLRTNPPPRDQPPPAPLDGPG
jgi:peptidoglycan/xylan/chitin deacetylase (PgdA/CDA1 family)